eukprot:TRINITY_DN9251_c0_g1_i1.p1 TRINITY_DN9251_c0_g1~~TRINITY_DN9251_c0_g1_i1.p1  ORF type:complete len:233 (+),score=4.23 TRINITY_DN9251_c0_g1_i1:198-896(+)
MSGQWHTASPYQVTNTFSTTSLSTTTRDTQETPWRIRSSSCGQSFASDVVRRYTCQPRLHWSSRKSVQRQHLGPGPGHTTNRLAYSDGDWPCTPAATHAAKQYDMTHPRPQSTEPTRHTYAPPSSRAPRPQSAQNGAPRYLTPEECRKLPKRCQSAPSRRKPTVFVQRGAGEKGHLCERARTQINFCPSGTVADHRLGIQNAMHCSKAAGRPPSRNGNGVRIRRCTPVHVYV